MAVALRDFPVTRRSHPESLRQRALELVTGPNAISYYQAAVETGVPHDTIRYWYRQRAIGGAAKPKPKAAPKQSRASARSGVIAPRPYAYGLLWGSGAT